MIQTRMIFSNTVEYRLIFINIIGIDENDGIEELAALVSLDCEIFYLYAHYSFIIRLGNVYSNR